MSNKGTATSKPWIVAAHCGTGKTTYANAHDGALDFVIMPYKYNLPDSVDPSVEKESTKAAIYDRNWAYPRNYINALVGLYNQGEYDTILIPPDLRVLAALEEKGIPYTLVYPGRNLKGEYEKRFVDRGNNEEFLSVFIDRWDQFIEGMEAMNPTERIVLQQGQFLEDVLTKQKCPYCGRRSVDEVYQESIVNYGGVPIHHSSTMLHCSNSFCLEPNRFTARECMRMEQQTQEQLVAMGVDLSKLGQGQPVWPLVGGFIGPMTKEDGTVVEESLRWYLKEG